MIRKATPSDLPSAVSLAIEALEIDSYDELLISRERVQSLANECISSPSHFAWVSEINGNVEGALLAFNSPMEFYERNSASILQWYCKNGDGMKLMSEFMSWFRSRPIIKQIQYTGERGADPRILEILKKRYGFRDDVPFLYLMR